jgi:hypothetical protein
MVDTAAVPLDGGAGAPEVTPAMVQAGLEVLLQCFPEAVGIRSTVTQCKVSF